LAVYEGGEADAEGSLVLGAINGALQARHSLRGIEKPAVLRRAVTRLLAS